jgi:hypothetical protein
MAIARNELWHRYFVWLFDILERVENHCKEEQVGMKLRAIGFLAERLFTWWIFQSACRVVGYPVLELDKSGFCNLKRAMSLVIKKAREPLKNSHDYRT